MLLQLGLDSGQDPAEEDKPYHQTHLAVYSDTAGAGMTSLI